MRATLRNPLSSEADRTQTEPVWRAPSAAGAVAQPLPSAVTLRAEEVMRDIVRHVGVTAEVTARNEEDHVLLELSGDSSGVLIGRRGQMLDALEYIINRIATRDDTRAPRIVVDSQNYRARRRTALEDLARRMAEQAKKKRAQVVLNPMSPRDRRIVHLVLQEDPLLTTRSSGKGYFRRLVIIPERSKKSARADS